MRLRLTAIAILLLPSSWALAVTTTTVSFQNGIDSYMGTFDRYILQSTGGGFDGSAFPDATLIGATASTSTAQQGLIRFDNIFGNGLGLIPLGAKIIDASLQLSTSGGVAASTDGSNGPFTVAGLTSSFDSTTNFTSYAGGHGAWFEDGHSTRPQGNFGRLDVGETQRTDIRSIVQQWSDQSLANNGLAVTTGLPGPTDTWKILTTSNTSPGSRPKLNVTYTMDNLQTSTFQRDLNGYTNVDSARVTSKCNLGATVCSPTTEATTNGNAIGSMTLQLSDATSAEQVALFRFNDVFGLTAGQAPANKPVAKAFLVLTTLASSNTAARIPDPVEAYTMQRSWTTSSLFSDTAVFGANPGLQAADGDIAQETLARTLAAANDSEVWFDVTNYYERLRNGAANNGIAIQARAADGWQFVMNGTGSYDARRPRLVVISDLSGPSAPGNFNNDAQVDAADYVVWRKNDTANAALPNDNGVGNQAARYDLWRANFGSDGPVAPPQATTLLKYDPSPKNNIVGSTLPDLPAAPTPTGVTGLTLVRGNGINPATLAQGFSSSNWTQSNIADPTTDRQAAIDNLDYYEWGLSLDATHTASLSALDVSLRRSSNFAASNFELQASLDSFATPIILSTFTYKGRVDGDAPTPDPSLDTPFYYMTNDQAGRPDTGFSPSDPIPQLDLTAFSQLQNIAAGSTVKFRLYAWGATSDTSTIAFRVNGPRITGIVSAISGLGTGAAIPEPSTALLAGICAAFLAACRRRQSYL